MAVNIKSVRPHANRIRSGKLPSDIKAGSINTAEALELIEQNERDLAEAVNSIQILNVEQDDLNGINYRYPDRTGAGGS